MSTKSVVPFSVPASAPVRLHVLSTSGPIRTSSSRTPAPPSIWPLIEPPSRTLNRSTPAPPAEVLDPAEARDAGDRAAVGAGDVPLGAGRRPDERVAAGAADDRDVDREDLVEGEGVGPAGAVERDALDAGADGAERLLVSVERQVDDDAVVVGRLRQRQTTRSRRSGQGARQRAVAVLQQGGRERGVERREDDRVGAGTGDEGERRGRVREREAVPAAP